MPCYTFQENNIVLIHDFKEYCAFLFFKGALLKDPKGILLQQTKNVQAARQVRFTKAHEFSIPEEFQIKLDETPNLRAAFGALTPGRQRAYLLHFAGAKQSQTRAARVEKCIQQILKGKGLDD